MQHRLEIEVRFPLGVYHAQSASAFDAPEWPPHPVRLIAALLAAVESLPAAQIDPARAVVDELSACVAAPTIVAPRLLAQADGKATVAGFRGASRWAPRNHELGELKKKGVHPRDLGRGRAAVAKGGVAIGDVPVTFSWPLPLDEAALGLLDRVASEVTFLGTSRSPVIACARMTCAPGPEAAWVPVEHHRVDAVDVRVATPGLPATLDAWHDQRAAPTKRNGAPARAGFVPPASLGRIQAYGYGTDPGPGADPFVDPQWWGDMLVLSIDRDSDVRPKAAAAFALARATRSALLARFADAGDPQEAPSVLRARGAEPHAAIVPLPFVGHPHADGRIIGIAVVLPHSRRSSDVLIQRREIERGARALVEPAADGARLTIGVPGVGDVLLGRAHTGTLAPVSLREDRWRGAAATWATVTPVVHSRYRRNGRRSRCSSR